MNKIQLETEQKKEYVAPQMDVVEMENQTSLLEGSPAYKYYHGPIE